MQSHASHASPDDQLRTQLLAPALALLPEGAIVAPRYYQLAEQLNNWGMPPWLVRLGLLLRALKRGIVSAEQIGAAFGPEAGDTAAALVASEGSVLRPQLQDISDIWKLFTLTYRHPPAGVVKIAELLAQLRHTHAADIRLSPGAIRTLAELCARFGMWDVRHELRDIAARLDDPHLVEHARRGIEQSRAARTAFFNELRARLIALLGKQGIEARVQRWERTSHQVIEDGLDNTGGSLPWTDLALVEVSDIASCYRALGAINVAFRVYGRHVRDYVGDYSDNGYQAIHTRIEWGPYGERRSTAVDVRIATAEMFRYNRAGLLASLAGVPVPSGRQTWWDERRRWLAIDSGESNEIYVFTPKAEVVYLPPHSTVLDFAVRVHSDLGVFCRGALVNNLRVTPGETLQCGDICEVLIDQHGTPIDGHLLHLARTNFAKGKIRRALQQDKSGAASGRKIFREVLARRLEMLDLHADETAIEQQVARICRERGYQTTDAFYRAVARGESAPDVAVRLIAEALLIPRLDLSALPAEARARAQVRLSPCCWPRPSRPAVAAVVQGGHQIKIHVAGCERLHGPQFPVAWRPPEDRAYVADVLYESWDRPGLIQQITAELTRIGGINIRDFEARVPDPSLARVRFSFETERRETVDRVRDALRRLPERRHVEVRAVTLIEEGFRTTARLENPYGPGPVGRWPLFVGRDAEVERIMALLGGGSSLRHILIRGPKRIGKSSLLEHLSRHRLGEFAVPPTLDLQSLPTAELRFPRLLARFVELIGTRAGPRVAARPPDAAMLERDPIRAFAAYLAELRERREVDRFVLLIDELGVVAARLRGTPEGDEFFDQWRALLNDERVSRHLAFVVAVPDVALEQHDAANAAPLRVGELGHPVRLSVLDERDARDLMTAPIKTHLEYESGDIDRLLLETGGHPYYTHLVCSQIVAGVQARLRRTGVPNRERQVIPRELVDEALAVVFAHSDAFHHVLHDSSPGTVAVLRAVAAAAGEGERLVAQERLRPALEREKLPQERTIARALQERPDLLVEEHDRIGIRVALVARWLRRNVV